ncbi:putative phosphatase regulatory subunit-domain-containing protein [Pilobolus umbonatus]|nr:putative phosphatase regulatory subunit-domain-containing protein [Pilobolus umbonatus]
MSLTSSTHSLSAYNEDKPNSFLHRRVTLIKRPPLIRSSPPPSTNIHRVLSNSNIHKNNLLFKQKKSVRFCDNASLENVRLFLKTQMPKACRSDPVCPKKYVYSLKCPNWPSTTTNTRRTSSGTAVRMETIDIDTDPNQENSVSLMGTCRVANIAFEKHVYIVYTQDEWTTQHEVKAVFQESIAESANTWDRFSFKIDLDNMRHAHKTLYMAVRYVVAGREFWDNNDSQNYEINIVPHVQLTDDSSSCPSDDDGNTFDDCYHMDDKDDALSSRLNVLTVKDHPYDDSSIHPLYGQSMASNEYSPPTSPDTPTDNYPLFTHGSNYFVNESKPNHDQSTLMKTEYEKFHHLIQKYCFYQEKRNPSFYTPYHSEPQCTSPRSIHS